MDTAATQRRDAVAQQLFGATIGALEILHVYLGRKLGLYDALAGTGPVNADELAAKTGVESRYAREWLEQQACAGVLDVAEDTGAPDTRRFVMPEGVEEVLCRPDSLSLVSPLASMVVGIAQALPQVLDAFRTGGGVAYEAYGADLRDGIAAINRPAFTQQLATWIPALPDLHQRLVQPGARVADLGCGTGWSTVAIARAFPRAEVHGLDLDEGSIATAISHAEAEGFGDRVSFRCRDAADPALAGQFDLVTLFETLHDMAHPVDALRAARSMLKPHGAVLVADERVAETFAAPGDDIERFNYGWSAVHCLPAAMTVRESAAIGTVIRPSTVARLAQEAGLAACTVLPIEHDFWRFYRLDP